MPITVLVQFWSVNISPNLFRNGHVTGHVILTGGQHRQLTRCSQCHQSVLNNHSHSWKDKTGSLYGWRPPATVPLFLLLSLCGHFSRLLATFHASYVALFFKALNSLVHFHLKSPTKGPFLGLTDILSLLLLGQQATGNCGGWFLMRGRPPSLSYTGPSFSCLLCEKPVMYLTSSGIHISIIVVDIDRLDLRLDFHQYVGWWY